MFRVWEAIVDFFKGRPYWKTIEPILSLAYIYLALLVLLYEYIQWQYRITPPLSLYLTSYLVKQATTAFAAVALLLLLFSGSPTSQGPRAWIGRTVRSVGAFGAWRLAFACAVLAGAAVVVVRLAPVQASHVRVKFLSEPDSHFDKYAFIYILFELNKLQRSWYFDVDFDPFNENALTSTERERCAGTPLCLAKVLAAGEPLIGITTESLGEDSFAQNDGQTSVISTFGWENYAPPSVYEFLAYGVVVQSILIHLNSRCQGLPKGTMTDSRIARGDLFQFSPRRSGMKAEILAAHLSRQGENLLMNCFGIEYLETCSRLLTLAWLRGDEVRNNLQRAFGVDLLAPQRRVDQGAPAGASRRK